MAESTRLRVALDRAALLADGEAIEGLCVLFDAVRETLGLPEDYLATVQSVEPVAYGEALEPNQFGKFVASPWGEPTDDERCRSFDTEAEAREYAEKLVAALGAPYYMDHLNRVPGDAFVVVVRLNDDEEARAEAIDGYGSWTPYGWADSTGYHEGTFEESPHLWP